MGDRCLAGAARAPGSDPRNQRDARMLPKAPGAGGGLLEAGNRAALTPTAGLDLPKDFSGNVFSTGCKIFGDYYCKIGDLNRLASTYKISCPAWVLAQGKPQSSNTFSEIPNEFVNVLTEQKQNLRWTVQNCFPAFLQLGPRLHRLPMSLSSSNFLSFL